MWKDYFERWYYEVTSCWRFSRYVMLYDMSWICLCFCLDQLLQSLQLSVKNQILKHINLKHSNVHPYPCTLFSHVLWKCIQILCSVKLPHSKFQLKNSILYDNFLYNSESSLPLVRNYDGYCTNADFNTSNLFLFIKKCS